jgi:hypothetical protein
MVALACFFATSELGGSFIEPGKLEGPHAQRQYVGQYESNCRGRSNKCPNTNAWADACKGATANAWADACTDANAWADACADANAWADASKGATTNAWADDCTDGNTWADACTGASANAWSGACTDANAWAHARSISRSRSCSALQNTHVHRGGVVCHHTSQTK